MGPTLHPAPSSKFPTCLHLPLLPHPPHSPPSENLDLAPPAAIAPPPPNPPPLHRRRTRRRLSKPVHSHSKPRPSSASDAARRRIPAAARRRIPAAASHAAPPHRRIRQSCREWDPTPTMELSRRRRQAPSRRELTPPSRIPRRSPAAAAHTAPSHRRIRQSCREWDPPNLELSWRTRRHQARES